nr:uncharacterized protein LOC119177837 [Rhipicephalus microplus]
MAAGSSTGTSELLDNGKQKNNAMYYRRQVSPNGLHAERKPLRVFTDSHAAYSEIFRPASEDTTAAAIQSIIRRHKKADRPIETIWTPGHTGVPWGNTAAHAAAASAVNVLYTKDVLPLRASYAVHCGRQHSTGKAALRFQAVGRPCTGAVSSRSTLLGWRNTPYYKQNHFLADICGGEESCFSPGHLASLCSRAQTQVFKFTRLYVTQVQSWIKRNPEIAPSVRVIHLVRDPRAVYASRRRLGWCKNHKQCGSATALCDQMRSNLDAFGDLGHHLPNNRTYQIRYEDLTADPLNETKRLFASLGLQFTPSVYEYVVNHTTASGAKTKDAFSTWRNAKEVADRWKRRISPRKDSPDTSQVH